MDKLPEWGKVFLGTVNGILINKDIIDIFWGMLLHGSPLVTSTSNGVITFHGTIFNDQEGTNDFFVINGAGNVVCYDCTFISNGVTLTECDDIKAKVSGSGTGNLILDNCDNLTILYPNGGETLFAGSNYNIDWISADDVTNVNLEYSTSGSGGPWIDVPGGQNVSAASQSFTWVSIPAVNSTNCFVKISDVSSTLSDISDDSFEILDISTMTLTLASPNGGEHWIAGEAHNITWESENITDVDLHYSTNEGSDWIEIISGVPAGSGSYNWNPIPKTPSTECIVRVRSNRINDIYDHSDEVFNIIGLDISSPDGGETLLINQNYRITWEQVGVDNIRLQYSSNNGTDWTTIVGSYPASAEFYTWTTPAVPSNQYLVKIMDIRRSAVFDVSQTAFSISGVKLLTPAGGENWLTGTTHDIEWISQGLSNMKIEYSTDNGGGWITIISQTPANLNKYSWEIPLTPSTECKVRASEVGVPSNYDMNNDNFTIAGTGIVVMAPNGGEKWNTSTVTTIKWASANVLTVKIEYTIDNGYSWHSVDPNLNETIAPASIGFYDWTLPNTPSVECSIRITDIYNSYIFDESDNLFRIVGYPYRIPISWKYDDQTGNEAIVIVPTSINPMIGSRPFETEDVVGVFYNKDGNLVCAGYAKWIENNNMAITVWGDNNRTVWKDGFTVGENYLYKVWDAQEGVEIIAQVEYSVDSDPEPEKYAHNKISILSLLTTHSELSISLPRLKWSVISSNLLPIPDDIVQVMTDVENEMDYMKNDEGEVYFPRENVNSILNWNIVDGYQIFMFEDAALTIEGPKIDPSDHPISLKKQYWYIIAYLSPEPLFIATALNSIHSDILMVKNQKGKIYFPLFNINQIGTMYPGEGYKLCVNESCILTYPLSGSQPFNTGSTNFNKIPVLTSFDKYRPEYIETGNSAVLVVESDDLSEGAEIGVFNELGMNIGYGAVESGRALITIWGDNIATDGIIEGALDNEKMDLRYWSDMEGKEYALELAAIANLITGRLEANEMRYYQDGIWLAQVNRGAILSTDKIISPTLELTNAPNPFNNITIINYEIPYDEFVTIEIINIYGDNIKTLVNKWKTSGSYSLQFNANKLENGVYVCKLRVGNNIETIKMLLIK